MKLIDILPVIPKEVDVEIRRNIQEISLATTGMQYMPIKQVCLFNGKSQEIPIRFAQEEVNCITPVDGCLWIILYMKTEYAKGIEQYGD